VALWGATAGPPPPPVAHRTYREGSWRSPGYRSGRRRAQFAMVLLVIVGLVCLWELGLVARLYGMLDDATRGVFATDAEISSMVETMDTADGVLILGEIATAIAFIAWLSRSVDNVPPLGGGVPSRGPRAAIAWWFVPVAFFWMPFLVVREAWDRLAAAGRPNRRRVLLVWWLAWIVGVLVYRAAQSVASTAASIEEYQGVTVILMAAEIALVIAAVAGVLVVREMQQRADVRAVALGLEVPAARWPVQQSVPSLNPSTAPAPAAGLPAAYCPSCGRARGAGLRFCAGCGTDLDRIGR
jgi:Domain of unknown function (DUF4328)